MRLNQVTPNPGSVPKSFSKSVSKPDASGATATLSSGSVRRRACRSRQPEEFTCANALAVKMLKLILASSELLKCFGSPRRAVTHRGQTSDCQPRGRLGEFPCFIYYESMTTL